MTLSASSPASEAQARSDARRARRSSREGLDARTVAKAGAASRRKTVGARARARQEVPAGWPGVRRRRGRRARGVDGEQVFLQRLRSASPGAGRCLLRPPPPRAGERLASSPCRSTARTAHSRAPSGLAGLPPAVPSDHEHDLGVGVGEGHGRRSSRSIPWAKGGKNFREGDLVRDGCAARGRRQGLERRRRFP